MLRNIFKDKLLPVVTLPNADSAVFVAQAFLEAGLHVMEVTFRTDATLPAIAAIVKRFPEMTVGTGTILSPDQLSAARDMGAQFGLSPAFNKKIALEAKKQKFPFIPGVLTPSEIEEASAEGFDILKLFPVNSIGGADYIKNIEGPYLQTGLQVIPMGGINIKNLDSYLSCKSVLAIGGSWLSPASMIKEKQFQKITRIVRESIEIVSNSSY